MEIFLCRVSNCQNAQSTDVVFQHITCIDLLDLDCQSQLYSTMDALFFGITAILFFVILVLFVIIFIFIFHNLQICCFKQSISGTFPSQISQLHSRQYPSSLQKMNQPEYFELKQEQQSDFTRQILHQCQCPGACNCDSINSKHQFPIYEEIHV